MKKLVTAAFSIYHLVSGSPVASCRFRPTCSQYALDAIEKYGFPKGTLMTLARLASCQPFSKRPFYDPV